MSAVLAIGAVYAAGCAQRILPNNGESNELHLDPPPGTQVAVGLGARFSVHRADPDGVICGPLDPECPVTRSAPGSIQVVSVERGTAEVEGDQILVRASEPGDVRVVLDADFDGMGRVRDSFTLVARTVSRVSIECAAPEVEVVVGRETCPGEGVGVLVGARVRSRIVVLADELGLRVPLHVSRDVELSSTGAAAEVTDESSSEGLFVAVRGLEAGRIVVSAATEARVGAVAFEAVRQDQLQSAVVQIHDAQGVRRPLPDTLSEDTELTLDGGAGGSLLLVPRFTSAVADVVGGGTLVHVEGISGQPAELSLDPRNEARVEVAIVGPGLSSLTVRAGPVVRTFRLSVR